MACSCCFVAGILQQAYAGQASNSQASLTVNEQVAAGQKSLAQRQYSEAMDRFEAVLAIQAGDLTAHTGEVEAAEAWALEEVRAHHPEQGMEVLERAITVLPKEPELLLDFGIEATVLKQFPIAQQALGAANELQPHSPKILYAMARLAVEAQHLEDAEHYLKGYLALRPDDASAHFGMGHVYAMEQRPEEARAEFETSLELQPQQTESYYQLGQLALQAQQDAAAKPYFERALAGDPHHAGALTGMGQLALRAKQYAAAEDFLAKAETADPNYPLPHYYRGLALARLGRKAEAAEELRRGDDRPHASLEGTGATSPAPAETGSSGAVPH